MILLSKYLSVNKILSAILIAGIFSVFMLTGCTTQSSPRITLVSKKNGRTSGAVYYSILTIRNEGDQPAYFVIALVHAKRKGAEIGYAERGFGDLFPNETKSDTVFFNNFGFIDPDTLQVSFTYQLANSIPTN